MAGRNPYSRRHVVAAYRSGLEQKVADQLEAAGVNAVYEGFKIPYTRPISHHTYNADFVLPNGIIVETKGLFEVDDRKKHLLLKEQHPDLDIRFVFSNSRSKLYKGSKTTYGDWCEKNGYRFADKLIPANWLREPKNEASLKALGKVAKAVTKKGGDTDGC